MKNLIIIGCGAFARELYWHATRSKGYGTDYKIKGFIDGDIKVADEEYKKLPLQVFGDINNYKIENDDVFACAICTPAVRKKIIKSMLDKGADFINIIHETSIIQENVKLGNGIILCPYTYVNDHATVGDYVMINTMSGLGHDAEIGEYSCIMGHVELCGFVKAGKETYFGGGSRVLPHGKVGDGAYVGSGSIVLRKVKTNDKVFGNPAVSIL